MRFHEAFKCKVVNLTALINDFSISGRVFPQQLLQIAKIITRPVIRGGFYNEPQIGERNDLI